MAAAEVGDDVFGEDPSVNALQDHVAELLGHEAGLFTPSGSLANQLALRLHVTPGNEFVSDALAHVVRAEMGAAAIFSGLTSRTWSAPRGELRHEDALEVVTTGVGPYQVCTDLVVVENTHNFGGGTVQPVGEITALRARTQALGVAMHLDGARLANAHVASGVSLSTYGGLVDSVSLCLSKGLGAPVGSVLVGPRDFIAEARVWRKRYGGGLRQAGILAAAGIYALEHNVQRLAQDHARAQRLAHALADVTPELIDPASVHTNIVVAKVDAAGWTASDFVSAALAHGVRGYALDAQRVRFVFHLDVDDAGTAYAVDTVTSLLRSPPS